MLHTVIQKHSEVILTFFWTQLQHNKVFSPPGVVSLILDGMISFNRCKMTFTQTCVTGLSQALRVHLCGDEVLIITIDSRTGRLNLRDTGDLAAAGRGPGFVTFSDRLNENPAFLMDALFRLRLSVSRYSSRRRYQIYISYRPSLTWPSKRQITWASKVIEEEIS
jgi:mediator of RNA polymerase II transcription subunit 14